MLPYSPSGALSYVTAGSGLPVVLLHGFCESKSIWANYFDSLAEKYLVIALDLPGFGDNPALEGPLTIADMAEAIQLFLNEKQIERCVMIGHSLGGYVALAFGEKYNDRLLGLGLFHSTAYADSLEKKQGRTKSIEAIETHGVAQFVEEVMPPLFAESRRHDLHDQIHAIVEQGKLTPKTTVIETIKAMRDRKDRSKSLEKASYPILFIAGKHDSAINFSASTSQFWIPARATIHIMKEVGHMGMIEEPTKTLQIVMQFLQQVQ
jgi:pimeloyl-ACP methyl ester carboxylesterase